MITPDDLIVTPIQREVLLSTINLVKHLLYHQQLPSAAKVADLQRLVLQITSDLIFRRILTQQQIPHTFLIPPYQTATYKGAISIGGRGCNLNFHLFNQPPNQSNANTYLRDAITLPRQHPAFNPAGRETIEVFGALVTNGNLMNLSLAELSTRGEMVAPIHLLNDLSNPLKSGLCHKLELQYDAEQALQIEVAGLDDNLKPVTEIVQFDHHNKIFTRTSFSKLTFLSANVLPESGLRLTFGQSLNYLVPASAWANLWLNVRNCVFFGFLHSTVLRQRFENRIRTDTAFRVHWFRKEKQTISVLELNSLPKLFEMAKKLDQSGQ